MLLNYVVRHFGFMAHAHGIPMSLLQSLSVCCGSQKQVEVTLITHGWLYGCMGLAKQHRQLSADART